ncbi:MAG: C10 family peptidase [Prevotella sp.]|nr:C10 family peptidase [Prevotella sp.]
MKKIIVIGLVLSLMQTIAISAGNVTPDEALQQATKFMSERVTKGARRAPAAASRLTMAKEVCGLYVFNIGRDDGFVIVSPDDRTEAILGYADSGSVDPDNMPENMRSWLQGYADEIAWLDAHNYQPSPSAARRTRSAVKAPIAPLVTSRWNQSEPYNNQVKTFAPDCKSGVTGCTVTAMAQVMYYTAKQAGLETSILVNKIPMYRTNSRKVIPGVSANKVIRWDLMRDTYNKNDADEGADAVATLMRICGAVLQVEYKDGVTSGQGEDIPALLQYYFGYAKSVQTADRSYYSYANWIEMVYNELAQGRAVVYGGQSLSSGHEFVCDGYEGEDYFHINWGWGGKSDGYFQLSVLYPNEQGIGGSSSGDGYSTGQHAVVGIQLAGGTGTVLSNPNVVDLTLNNVTTDKTDMTIGETAHITFNVTNNSTDDYDGELGFHFFENRLGDGKMFLIPAGETKDCVMEYRPTSAGTYKITAYQTNGEGRFIRLSDDKYVEVTVTEGGGGNPTSDEIELVSTMVVENSTTNKLYGTILKGTLTLTNPETDTDYSSWFELGLQVRDDSWRVINYIASAITVPANSSIDIPVVFSGLEIGKTYRLVFTRYVQGSGWTDWETFGDDSYECSPAIMSYATDGAMSVIPTHEASYDAPAGVLFVDISGTGITDVTHEEPNCTFLMRNTDPVPTGTTNCVLYDGSDYTATNLTLTDGHDFYTPVDFTADNIVFTYNCDRWADGTNGWNTIILPFDVTSVTADDKPIDWFHSSSDTGKQFWLKEFVGDETDAPKVYFDNVWGTMQANTPYLIALPGNCWGEANDLRGKTIKFLGSGDVKKTAQTVITASNHRFVGNTMAVNIDNIYCINNAGNRFELKPTGGSTAFHPYFKVGAFDRDIERSVPGIEYIAIGIIDETTGINEVRSEADDARGDVFDLQGRRVAKTTRKGLYIMNGKKIVLR